MPCSPLSAATAALVGCVSMLTMAQHRSSPPACPRTHLHVERSPFHVPRKPRRSTSLFARSLGGVTYTTIIMTGKQVIETCLCSHISHRSHKPDYTQISNACSTCLPVKTNCATIKIHLSYELDAADEALHTVDSLRITLQRTCLS